MAKSYETRVDALERSNLSGTAFGSFIRTLKQARLRAIAGEASPPETPITAEMMEDPVHGEFCRQLFEARERVRISRQ
jgi:hypothetical protein